MQITSLSLLTPIPRNVCQSFRRRLEWRSRVAIPAEPHITRLYDWVRNQLPALPRFSLALSPHDWSVSLGPMSDRIRSARSSVLFAVMEPTGTGQYSRRFGRSRPRQRRTDGNLRYSWTKNQRSLFVSFPAPHIAPQNGQLVSERRILQPALRLEWRSQDGQNNGSVRSLPRYMIQNRARHPTQVP